MPEYIITNSKGKEKRYSFPTADSAADFLDAAAHGGYKTEQVFFDTDNTESRRELNISLDDDNNVIAQVVGADDWQQLSQERNPFSFGGYKPMTKVYGEAMGEQDKREEFVREQKAKRMLVDPAYMDYDPTRSQRAVQSVQGLGEQMGAALQQRGISPIDATQPMSNITPRTSSPIVDSATAYASERNVGWDISPEDAQMMDESEEYKGIYWNIRRRYGLTPQQYLEDQTEKINKRIDEALAVAEDMRDEAFSNPDNWHIFNDGTRANAAYDQAKATIRAIKSTQRDLNDSRVKYGGKDGWHFAKRFWDGGELLAKMTPIYNMISSLEQAGVALGQVDAAGQMIDHPENLTPEQKLLHSLTAIQNSVAQMQEDMGGKHWGSGAGEVISEMPEFMMGMPLAKAFTKGVTKGGAKIAKKLAGEAIKEVAEQTAEQAAETVARRALDKATGWGKAWAKSLGESAIGAPTQTLFYQSLADEAMGQYQVRPDGSTIQIVTPAWQRVYRAWLGTALELHSEDMGMWIGKGLSAIGRRMANVGFVRGLMRVPAARTPLMAVIRKEFKVADPISEALGEVYGDAIQPLMNGDLDWSQTLADPDYWLTTVVSSAGVSVAMELPTATQYNRVVDRVNKYGQIMDYSLAEIVSDDVRQQIVAAVSHNNIAAQCDALAHIDWSNASRYDMAAAMDYVNAYVGRELYYSSWKEAERMEELQRDLNNNLAIAYRGASGFGNTMTTVKATAKPSLGLPLGAEYYIISGDYATQGSQMLNVMRIDQGQPIKEVVFADQLDIAAPVDIAEELATRYEALFAEELANDEVSTLRRRIEQMKAEGVPDEQIAQVVSSDPAYHEYKTGDVVTDKQTGAAVTIEDKVSTGDYLATKSDGERIKIGFEQIADSGAYAEQANNSAAPQEGAAITYRDSMGVEIDAVVSHILDDGRIFVHIPIEGNPNEFIGQTILPSQIVPAESSSVTPTEEAAEAVAEGMEQATETQAAAEPTTEPHPVEDIAPAPETTPIEVDARAVPTLEDGSIDYDAIDDPQQFINLYGKDMTTEELIADVTSFRDDARQNAERLNTEAANVKTPNEKKALRDQAKIEANRANKYQAVLDLLIPTAPVAEQTEVAPEIAPVAEEVVEPTTEEQATEQPKAGKSKQKADNGVKEWYENLRLSGELDQNNSPFVLNPKSTLDFGQIQAFHNLPPAPIRLSMGDVENGYIHINRRHGKEIQKAGFSSIEEFVQYVANNITRIQEGDSYPNEAGGNNDTYIVQAQGGHNNTLFIQLSRDGEYWNVNSAGVFKKSYGNSKKNIWSASEVQSGNSAVAIDGSQSKPNADEGSTSNGTPSNISDSKDTTTEPITQEVEQENLQPTPESTAEEQVEVSAVENEDADEQPALSPEERTAQVEDPNSVLFTTMLDNAYRSGDARRIDYNERFVRALLNRTVNVDGLKRLIQNQTGESSDPEHNAILQRRYAFIREVATSRINDIEAEQTMQTKPAPAPKSRKKQKTYALTTVSGAEVNVPINLYNYVSDDATKALCGVYFDPDGFIVASDGSNMIVIKHDVAEADAGKGITKAGDKIKYTLKWKPIRLKDESLQSPERKISVPIDFAEVEKRIGGKKGKTPVRFTIGEHVVGFAATSIHLLADFQRAYGGEVEFGWVTSDGRGLSITSGDNYAIVIELLGEKEAIDGVEDVVVPIGVLTDTQADEVAAQTPNESDNAETSERSEIQAFKFLFNDDNKSEGFKAQAFKRYIAAMNFIHKKDGSVLKKFSNLLDKDVVWYALFDSNKTDAPFAIVTASQEITDVALSYDIPDFEYVAIDNASKSVDFKVVSIPLEYNEDGSLKRNEEQEQPQPQQPTEPESKPKRAKRTADRKIEDFGEKIAGARKDILRDIAKAFDNATLESLIALPFAKAFVKPDLKKLVEEGVLRPDDAKYAEAIMWVYINKNKPKARKTDKWKAARGRENRITEWAKKTFDGITRLREFIEADEATRDELIAQYDQLGEQIKVEEDADRARINRLNGGEVIFGDLYSPNPIKVIVAALDKLNYQAGDKIVFAAPIVKAEYLGRYFNFENQDGEKIYALTSVNSIEEAIDRLVLQAKIHRGDTDIQYPSDMFSITREDPIREPSGAYTVFYFNKRGSVLSETVDSKEAAEKMVSDYKAKGSDAQYREETRIVGYSTYRIRYKNRLTDVETIFDEKFGSEGEARQALEERYDEFNDLANDYVASLSKQKREQPVPFEVTTSWNSEIKGVKYVVKNTETGDVMSPQLDTRKETEAYYKNHIEEWKAKWQEMKDARKKFVFFDDNVNPREGKDYRNGRDVTAEDLATTFGFRGIQFGNWTNDADRQAALNQAYDAFMDLADILGVSPKALSLAGELGIAFGARGGGSALAHYEPDEIVINLTKTKGAGSLAHEWWHALDNYFSRQGNIPMGFVTSNPTEAKMREEMRAAWQGNVVLFQRGDFPEMPNTEANRRAYKLIREKLRKKGIEVHEVSEEMANAMASLIGVEFATKRKSATETVLPEDESSFKGTAISTADGAKILKNLDNLANKYQELSNRPWTFIGDVANALGISMPNKASKYGIFEAMNGNEITIRLSDHNATVSNLDGVGENNAISIVISRKPNNGITNDGNAHIVEYYYPASKIQKADGKPLVDIITSIKQALYSGEYEDITGLAEREEVNLSNAEYQIVYHGSGAKFDRFDHSFMGTGEGAQAYGWGTYVTQIKGIGETYAKVMRDKLISERHRENAIINDLARRIVESNNGDKQAALEYLRSLLNESWSDKKRVKAQIKILGTGRFLPETKIKANLYSVDIIDSLTPDTYISWEGIVDDEVIDRMQEKLAEEYGEEVALTANLKYGQSGKHLYRKLERALGPDRAASEFLHRNGFVGIEYPARYQSGGRADNAKNYVIFNENDLKIIDRVELFQDSQGKIYGWAVGGEIYLTPDGLNANTAIHEYSHLWVEAMRKKGGKKWDDIKAQLKDTPFWNEVLNDPNYEYIRNDEDKVASEVLARLAGKNGAARLTEEAQRIIDAGNGSLAARIEATAVVQRVKRLLRDFWAWVSRNIFGITNEATISRISDMVVDDLLAETPLEKAEGSPFEAMFIGELGANTLDSEQGAYTRMDNLDIAIQMDRAGRTPLDIKLSTGWERGADGEWRSEISDKEAHLNIEAMSQLGRNIDDGVRQRNAEKIRQFEKNSPLLAAKRQELINKHSVNSSAVEALDEVFGLTPVVAEFKLRDLFDYDAAYDAYPQLMNMRVRIVDGMRARGAQWGSNIDISLDVAQIPARMRGTLLHEIQHAIQSIEGFASGGNMEIAEELMREMEQEVLIYDFAALLRSELRDNPELTDNEAEEAVIAEIEQRTGQTREQLEASHRIPVSRQREESLRAARDPELYEYYLNVFQIFNAALDDSGEIDAQKAYSHLMGEVEARNTTRRRDMTAAQRRVSLAMDTEDVNRGAQIYRARRSAVSESLSRQRDYDWVNFQPTGEMTTLDNFFVRTSAIFEEQKDAPKRLPDYISPSGSKYWYEADEQGDYVIRLSDHWSALLTDKGERESFRSNPSTYKEIASCRWALGVTPTKYPAINAENVKYADYNAGSHRLKLIFKDGKVTIRENVHPRDMHPYFSLIKSEDVSRANDYVVEMVNKDYAHQPIYKQVHRIGKAYLSDFVKWGNSENRARRFENLESLSKESQYSSRVEALNAVANEVAAKLNAPIRVVTDMNEVPKTRQDWKGWWQRGASGEQIVVVVPNHTDAADVERTILHEAVAHYGLRRLLGETKYNNMLSAVLDTLGEEEIERRKKKYGTADPLVAADEYIAEIAEGNVTPSMFSRAISAIRAFLRDILGLNMLMTDNDIRYLLWQSKNKLEGKSAYGRAMVMTEGRTLADMVAEEYALARNYTDEEQQIIAEAQRNGTYLKAPNGKPTNLTPKQWAQVRTKAFKEWFGDWESNPDNASKIVDANGEPKVVYHGTIRDGRRKFYEFNTQKPAWFDANSMYAESFYKDKSILQRGDRYAAFLDIKNPLNIGFIDWGGSSIAEGLAKETNLPLAEIRAIVDKVSPSWVWQVTNTEEFKQLAQRYGYDGLVAREGGTDSYAVFSPTQIKSAEINSGEFDPDDPDIRARRKYYNENGELVESSSMRKPKASKEAAPYHSKWAIGKAYESLRRAMQSTQLYVSRLTDDIVARAGEVELHRRIQKGRAPFSGREMAKLPARLKRKFKSAENTMKAYLSLSEADKVVVAKIITDFDPTVDFISAENRMDSQGAYKMKQYHARFIDPLNAARLRLREVMGVNDAEVETYASGESSLERHNSGIDALSTEESAPWSLKKVEEIVTNFRARLRNNMMRKLQAEGVAALNDAEKELLGEELVRKLEKVGYENLSAGEQMALCEAPVEVLWERIGALNNENLNILLRAGRYNHEDVERIKSHNWRYYVPLYRVDEVVEGMVDPFDRYDFEARGGLTAPHLHTAEGRNTKPQDIFRSMYQLGQRCIAFEVRNNAARTMHAFTHWAVDKIGVGQTTQYWTEQRIYQVKSTDGKWKVAERSPSRTEIEQMQRDQKEYSKLRRQHTDLSRQVLSLSRKVEAALTEQEADVADDLLRGLVSKRDELREKMIELEGRQQWRTRKSMGFAGEVEGAPESQRRVRVWIDGVEHNILFADPAMARAINGDKGWLAKAIELIGRPFAAFTRFRAQMNTQFSPDFIVSNSLRDFQHALLAMALAEQEGIMSSFVSNYRRHFLDIFRSRTGAFNPLTEAEIEGRVPYFSYERMRDAYLASQLRGEKISAEEFEMDYREEVLLNRVFLKEKYGEGRVRDTFMDAFMSYGGQTGFIEILNEEKIKKQFRKAMMLKEDSLARRYVDPTAPFRLVRDSISLLSESMEDITRFATFMAHLDKGASVEQAAQQAKDVTTNFNRRGELSSGIGSLYMFFNASIQGSAQVLHLIKHHPRRAAWVLPLYALLGFTQLITKGMWWKLPILFLIKGEWPDDDDDQIRSEEYLRENKQIPDYIYGDNLIFTIYRTMNEADAAIDGLYFKAPQPNGFRAAYKLGVELAETVMGEQRWGELPESALSTLAGELVYGFGDTGDLASDLWRGAVPTAVQPFVDLAINRDFVNRTIYPDRTYNPIAPSYTVAKSNTSEIYVQISKAINRIGGTDTRSADYNRRYEQRTFGLDVSPEAIQYLVGEMFGGVGTFMNRVMVTTELMAKSETPAMRDIPFANRVAGEFESKNVYPEYKAFTDQIEMAWKEGSAFRAAEGIDVRRKEWLDPNVTYPYLIDHNKDNPYAVEMLRKRWLLDPYFDEIEGYTKRLKALGEGSDKPDRASEQRELSEEAERLQAERTLTEKFILEVSKHVDWQAESNESVIKQFEEISGEVKSANR